MPYIAAGTGQPRQQQQRSKRRRVGNKGPHSSTSQDSAVTAQEALPAVAKFPTDHRVYGGYVEDTRVRLALLGRDEEN